MTFKQLAHIGLTSWSYEIMAPEKVRRNKHYREKIRQQLHLHFTRINRGVYASNTN